MPTHQLYASPFFEDDLSSEDPSAQRRLAEQGRLENQPTVRLVASEPGDLRIAGDFVGRYSDVMALEIEELLNSSTIDQVPYFVRSETRKWQGYYSPKEQRQGDRRDPRIPNEHQFEGVISSVGRRSSHYRSVRIRSDDSITNPFGSGTNEQLWLSNTVNRPRWFNESSGATESATVSTTEPAEHVTMARFDATEPAFSSEEAYLLVYDIPYDHEWQSDVRIWDDYGREKSITDSNGVTVSPTWARVYDPRHDYAGDRVLENGRLRLEPIPAMNTLDASRWNDSNSQYEAVSLGTSDWELNEWDIRSIGLATIRSLTSWQDSTDTSVTYDLVCILRRGDDEALFYEPENATSSTPAGLVTLLDPIADSDNIALGESAGVEERENVSDE